MQPSLLLAVLPAFVVGGNSDVTGLDVTQATAPAEQGVTWKDLFKSGSRVQFYGFLRLDAYYNTARMNNIILPFTVSPEDGSTVADDDAGFAFDPRLTRIGMDVKVGEVEGTKVNGKLEVQDCNPFLNYLLKLAQHSGHLCFQVKWQYQSLHPKKNQIA
jgi:hypothetical protein